MTPFVRAPFRRTEEATLVEDRPPVVEEEQVLPPPPPGPPPPRRPLLWPWLLLLLVLVIGGLVAAWLLTRDNGHQGASTVNVPNVVRLKQQEAVLRLNRRGLIARIATRASALPPGTVAAQDPGPGANVTRHSVVTLSVSALRLQAVPEVVGKSAAQAVQVLGGKGFRVKTKDVPSKAKPGTVLAQSPQAGARVGAGSTVTINVSRGRVAVPDVVGQQRSNAIATIRGAGLVPKAFVVPSSQPKNTVVAQSPRAGKRVADGSTVRLNVSNGSSSGGAAPPPPPAPATVSVPDVTGQLQDAAQKQLNAAGLKAGVIYVPSDQPQGTVVSQSPAGGKTVKRGTRVQLNVALGSQPGTLKGVPDVRNLAPATARSKLEAAGFKVQTLQQAVTDPAQVGKVVDEQPAGGRNAPAGSVITIYVGKKR